MSIEDQAGRDRQATPMTAHGAARRRLGKAGLGVAGVLWSTRSHAIDFRCVSPSAALSSGLSSNHLEEKLACEGKGPRHWKNQGGWPVPTTTLFGSIFPCAEHNQASYGMTTLLDMLRGKDFDQSDIGKHFVATYLNVKSGKIGFLSETTLFRMWDELQSSGHYQPARDIFWDIHATKKYLRSTYRSGGD